MSFVYPTSKKVKKQSNDDILNEITKTSRMLNLTNRWFDFEKDSYLIDACIYQRESLISKYNYLIKKAKQEKLTKNPK